MDWVLTEGEARALGSLVEKSITTPEYYPLSLNGLKNACNQKSSREPVTEFSEAEVAHSLEGLREKHLVWFVDSADSRVQKYRHRFSEALEIPPADAAILAVLLLRGPQTPGELRGRTERLHPFSRVEDVEAVLEGLSQRVETPFVVRLPRQPGRKEHRWMHTLCGLPLQAEEEGGETVGGAERGSSREPAAFREVRSERERLAALEAGMAGLREELQALREEVSQFRRQFE